LCGGSRFLEFAIHFALAETARPRRTRPAHAPTRSEAGGYMRGEEKKEKAGKPEAPEGPLGSTEGARGACPAWFQRPSALCGTLPGGLTAAGNPLQLLTPPLVRSGGRARGLLGLLGTPALVLFHNITGR